MQQERPRWQSVGTMVCHASVLPGCEHSRCGNPEMLSPQCSQWHSTPQACIDHLFRVQYPRCIECVSKWYRKTIQYRSPDGAKNVSCLYRKCIEQKVSRYCIEREISKITIHIRYTSIQFDTVRYIYRENAPRYIGKKAPFPVWSTPRPRAPLP